MKRMVLCVPIAALALVGFSMNVSSAKAKPSDDVTLRAHLTGAAISGITPKGNAEYSTEVEHGATQSELEVEVEKVNLPDRTALTVCVNSNAIGRITLRRKHGSFHVSTEHSGTVPAVQAGDLVTVKAADGSVVLSGSF